MRWVWLDRATLVAVHSEQIAEHGGVPGFRDEALFDAVLARPPDLAAQGEEDASDLAAAYAFGLARHRPFVDGNRRIAGIAAESFLRLNGFQLTASDAEFVMTLLRIGTSEIDRIDLADWLGRNSLGS